MGIYGQGASNAPVAQPTMGHPMYPPLNNYASYEQQPQPPLLGHPSPLAAYSEALSTNEWATRLCACCSDCDICCQTCWCPCVSFGQIAEILDEGRSTCLVQGTIYGLLCSVGIPCVYSFMWRSRLRRKYLLEKGCCGDFCVHCCCEACALCQEHRELQRRGMDPSLGWEVAQYHAGQTMQAPYPPNGMQRY